MLTPDITKNETIIVTGCSFTVQPYKPPDQELVIDKTWSTYIKCKKLINVAECGRGSYEMIKYALDYIFANPNEKIDRVIVALSGWQRFYTPYNRFTGHKVFWYSNEEAQNVLDNNLDGYIEFEAWWQARMGIPSDRVIKQMIDDTFINLNALYLVCKSKNIKLHVVQMLAPFHMPTKNTAEYNMMITTTYERLMYIFSVYEIFRDNKADLYGFPFLTELGGEWIWHKFYRHNGYRNYTIPGDGHPNEIAHKLICEKILENLNDFKL